MKECKPCITIRDVYFIFRNNIIYCYRNIRSDLKSYSMINATACVMDTTPINDVRFPESQTLKKIRELAIENHGKDEAELKEKYGIAK